MLERRWKTAKARGLRASMAGRVGWVVVWLALPAVLCFAAGPSADEILQKVRQAHKTATYSGVRVLELWWGGKKITLKQKAIFGGDGRQRFEVISPPAHAGELVVSDGRQQWRYNPRDKTAYLLPPAPPEHAIGPACSVGPGARGGHGRRPVGRGPRWKVFGREKVAGRDCYVLALVSPRGQTIAKLWVDAERFVVLGGEFATPDHARGRRWKFEQVTFDPKLAPGTFSFRPPPGVRVVKRGPAPKHMRLREAEAAAGMKALIPARLPDGYFFLADRVGVITKNGRKVLWLVFSNGAETFSIFQSSRLPANIRLPKGAVARWDVGPYTLIVVGNLSDADIKLMRQSLPRAAPAGPARRGRRPWGRPR